MKKKHPSSAFSYLRSYLNGQSTLPSQGIHCTSSSTKCFMHTSWMASACFQSSWSLKFAAIVHDVLNLTFWLSLTSLPNKMIRQPPMYKQDCHPSSLTSYQRHSHSQVWNSWHLSTSQHPYFLMAIMGIPWVMESGSSKTHRSTRIMIPGTTGHRRVERTWFLGKEHGSQTTSIRLMEKQADMIMHPSWAFLNLTFTGRCRLWTCQIAKSNFFVLLRKGTLNSLLVTWNQYFHTLFWLSHETPDGWKGMKNATHTHLTHDLH